MAAWTNLLNALFLPGKPILGSTGAALRDNALAIAEGAAGAPRVDPSALKAPGVSSGAISGTTWVGFTGLGAFKQIRFDMSSNQVATTTSFDVALSSDGGTSWGSSQPLAAVASNESLVLSGHIDLETGASARAGIRTLSTGVVTDASGASTLTVPANCNAIRFRFAAGARVGLIYLTPIGGRN